ncbi:P44/Msp2 family outer membrane protein [Candidatus Neoehrlichia procyonis]|uniref:Outer membrane beta-barrel domain protein n=1 Tax=Candidatus Neoehrlichia procyonis str. RAC413 TaxID=1359163 RepID=A0A0F3NR76_9RICK|nr:P44/Msp2 family outer membrane protein [Candidatus Neoehrlichia lotoris]KJV69414.1 outer membrane beta-barrel domain protein [Candidatus Neoehrlichia lotoris str. RAC413]
MNYKKFFVGSALMTLVSLLPHYSFSAPISASDSMNNDSSGEFYISMRYSPTFSQFRNFKINETNRQSTVKGYSKSDSSVVRTSHEKFTVENFQFKFDNNLLLAFNGAIGYSMGGPRVELEIGYERFNTISNDTYASDKAYKIVALGRNGAITANNYVTAEINNITTVSLMANACYDIPVHDMSLVPYVCAGIGSNLVNTTKDSLTPKFAYQAKAGVSYTITPEVSLTVGGFYHGIIGTKYEKLHVDNATGLTDKTSATAEFGLSYFGGELGVRFTL